MLADAGAGLHNGGRPGPHRSTLDLALGAEAPGGAYEAALSSTLDALVVVDAGGRVRAWNRSAEEMFGYSDAEACGHRIEDLIIPPELRDAHAAGLAHYLASGEPRIIDRTVEVDAVHRSGRRFAATLTVTRMPGEDAPLFLGAIRDLTPQREAEANRQEIETQFRSLVEQLPVVVFIDAADSHFTPLYVSAQIEQLLGYTVEEWLADHDLWVKSLHPEDKSFVLAKAMEAEYGPPFELEYRFLHRDGGTVWVREKTVTIFDESGVPRFSQGIFVDITAQKVNEERLRDAEARYRSLVEQTPAITFRTSPDSLFDITYVSPQIREILGFEPEEWLADPMLLTRYIHPDDMEPISEIVLRAMEDGEPFTFEFRQGTRDGRYVWLGSNGRLVRDASDQPLFWQGVLTDISARRRIEDAYVSLRDRFSHFAEHASDAIIAIDLEGRFLFSNHAFHAMSGYGEDELRGLRLSDMVHPDSIEHARTIAQRLLREEQAEPTREPLSLLARDGRTVVVELSASLVRSNEDVLGYQAIIRDVTERMRLQAELTHQAYHDNLTDLPNRARLFEYLQATLSRCRQDGWTTSLIFLDLDNFKVINDSLGHDIGDQALVEVANRMRACLRPEDFVARFGGDEFVIILGQVSSEASVVALAERIMGRFERPFRIAGRDVRITASIGIAAVSEGIERPEELLRRADLAMYRSKERGRNRYAIHDLSMDRVAFDRLELEADLRLAIERDQLSVVYQPVVGANTGEVYAVESLVRWAHPERGLLSPGDFIPIAEESDLIVKLDRWVMREACRQAREWRCIRGGAPMHVSFNVSARQLDQPDLLDFIDELLREDGGRSSGQLVFELTETAMMRDVEQARAMLEGLHARGIRIALDDFGMGYSSLAQIHHLPIDYIKIDRQFINEISSQREDLIIVSGMIELSHALGLAIVAEGVETPVQAHLIDELGCDFAQGFFYGRPCPPAEIAALLRRSHAGVGRVEQLPPPTSGEPAIVPAAVPAANE